MARVACDAFDCKYRSKRQLKAWSRPSGLPLYGCKRELVIISPVFDPDGDIEATAGKENTAVCKNYKPC